MDVKIIESLTNYKKPVESLYNISKYIDKIPYISKQMVKTPIYLNNESINKFCTPKVVSLGNNEHKRLKVPMKKRDGIVSNLDIYFDAIPQSGFDSYGFKRENFCIYMGKIMRYHYSNIVNIEKSRDIILKLCNIIWKNIDYINTPIWKHTKVYFIKKKNYNPMNSASFRPISVTSNFVKFFERCLLDKLKKITAIHECQYYTTSINDARKRVHRAEIVVFADIKNAFPNVDFPKLYERMLEASNDKKHIADIKNMFRYINEFYADHYVDHKDKKHLWNYGLFQGSPLSSYLFCIYINPLVAALSYNFGKKNVICYMDDIAVINGDVKTINYFIRKYGFIANRKKTKTTLTIERGFKYLGDTLYVHRELYYDNVLKKLKKLNKLEVSDKCKCLIYNKLFKSSIDRHRLVYKNRAKLHARALDAYDVGYSADDVLGSNSIHYKLNKLLISWRVKTFHSYIVRGCELEAMNEIKEKNIKMKEYSISNCNYIKSF